MAMVKRKTTRDERRAHFKKKKSSKSKKAADERFEQAQEGSGNDKAKIQQRKEKQKFVDENKGKDIQNEKPTIQLNEPKEDKQGLQAPNEEGVIDLTKQGQPDETLLSNKLGTAGIVGAGVALGTGAYLAGGAIAAKVGGGAVIKVSAATMNTVRNKMLAQQISSKLGTFGGNIVGKTTAFVSKTAPAAANFASNSKTISLTKKLLIGAGISLGVASIAKDLLGTYPFASFGKEETLQSISFSMNAAIKEGLLEEAQGLLDASNEIVNAAPSIVDKIPYANVQKEFTNFATQQAENNKVWQAVIDKQVGEIGQESEFAESRRKSDEEATQRKLEEQALDSEYFALIREGKFEEAEELLQSRLQGEE